MVRIMVGYPDVIEGRKHGEDRDQGIGRPIQRPPEFRLQALGAREDSVCAVQNRSGPQASAPDEHGDRGAPDKCTAGDKTYHDGG